MISNRFNPLGKSFVVDAKSYVQEDLDVHLDGIDNVGYGLHDSTAKNWISLINPTDKVSASGFVWVEDALSNPNNKTVSLFPKSLFYVPKTVELVITKQLSEKDQCAAYFCANQYKFSRNFLIPRTFEGKAHIAIRTDGTYSANPTDAFINKYGGATQQGSIRLFFGYEPEAENFIGGQIHAVRIYNRILTDAEIAHNYAVDKERFGL